MVEFKLVIANPKTAKCTQIVVSDANANSLVGKKIGDKIKGESFDMSGYEFEITGGADYCGFPMRKDIDGPVRKKIMITSGVGTRNKEKGIRTRKTVCGNTIHENITQVSMKILKFGKKPIGEEEAPAEKTEEKPVEVAKESPKEKPKTEEKPAEAPKEVPKEKPKTEEKPAEVAKESPKEKPKTEEKPVEVAKESPKEKPKAEEKPVEVAKEAPKEKPKAEEKPAEPKKA